ncbi:hypothetical protein D9758_016699 [Tetrapyrgos nigripes]|uniref:Uncharacterized protein n=1 Tax=Tetrapyrgos nigripes TaxID=182062 RepID=A0A8H5C666_9AGAR|nr:hypothetical protein D9758_016699 [Tetrapyrgos nigripes]
MLYLLEVALAASDVRRNTNLASQIPLPSFIHTIPSISSPRICLKADTEETHSRSLTLSLALRRGETLPILIRSHNILRHASQYSKILATRNNIADADVRLREQQVEFLQYTLTPIDFAIKGLSPFVAIYAKPWSIQAHPFVTTNHVRTLQWISQPAFRSHPQRLAVISQLSWLCYGLTPMSRVSDSKGRDCRGRLDVFSNENSELVKIWKEPVLLVTTWRNTEKMPFSGNLYAFPNPSAGVATPDVKLPSAVTVPRIVTLEGVGRSMTTIRSATDRAYEAGVFEAHFHQRG